MSHERPRTDGTHQSRDAWFRIAHEFASSGIEGPFQKLEKALQDHLREGYRLFFKTIRSQSGIQAEVPNGIADLVKPQSPGVVTFSRGDPRIIQSGNGFRLWGSNEWQVTVCGYKRNTQGYDPGYYKDHIVEQAVVILNPQGREFERIVFCPYLDRPKNPAQPFSSRAQCNMQIEDRVKICGRGATGGKLESGQSSFSQMTELDVLMLVNSLAQIFAKGSSVKKAHTSEAA